MNTSCERYISFFPFLLSLFSFFFSQLELEPVNLHWHYIIAKKLLVAFYDKRSRKNFSLEILSVVSLSLFLPPPLSLFFSLFLSTAQPLRKTDGFHSRAVEGSH